MLDLDAGAATDVASGARLLVDVEAGADGTLYALAGAGRLGRGGKPGAPALPNTGSLVTVNDDGTFTVVADGLNVPTSTEIVGGMAYVVSGAGEVYSVSHGRHDGWLLRWRRSPACTCSRDTVPPWTRREP